MRIFANIIALALVITIGFYLITAAWTLGGLLMCFFAGFGAITLSNMGGMM